MITLSMEILLVPGTTIWARFAQEGWNALVVQEAYSNPVFLKAKSCIGSKDVSLHNWHEAYQDGNIMISPN